MPVRIWSHICDYATVDSNGKLSIIGEFDHVYTQATPATHPFLFVASKWNGVDQEAFTHQVRITSPSGKEISKSGLSNASIQAMRDGAGNHVTVDAFLMTVFPEFGEYGIEILIDGNIVHVLPLSIIKMP